MTIDMLDGDYAPLDEPKPPKSKHDKSIEFYIELSNRVRAKLLSQITKGTGFFRLDVNPISKTMYRCNIIVNKEVKGSLFPTKQVGSSYIVQVIHAGSDYEEFIIAPSIRGSGVEY